MARKYLYQTLKDLGNYQEILEHGPYFCEDKNAWLGPGYYFWDTFIEPAHHWGKKHCRKGYVICKGLYTIADEKLFDLVGNLEHRQFLARVVEELIAKKLVKKNKTTVPRIISYLKDVVNVFPFIASRADTTLAFKEYDSGPIIFNDRLTDSVIFLRPAIQICIYDLEKVEYSDYQIAYPIEEEIVF